MILFERRDKNKKLFKRLQSLTNHVRSYKHGAALSVDALTGCELFLCFGIHSEEVAVILNDFLDRGGSVAIFSSAESCRNNFLRRYGIRIEEGAVVRAVFRQGFLHPKHVLVQNGIVQPFEHEPSHGAECDKSSSMAFVFPNGSTLNVEAPAITLLSSGTTSYPVDCPVAAAWEATTGSGRLIVVGSADIFSDDWLEREDNSKLCDALIKYLLHQGMSFNPSLGRSDFEEKECAPDISYLSNLIKPCLKELDQLPEDYKSLLCDKQFGLTMDQPLSPIEPRFNCPHPPLQMSLHAPRLPARSPLSQEETFGLEEGCPNI
jgi:intraflagellar transport protein 52